MDNIHYDEVVILTLNSNPIMYGYPKVGQKTKSIRINSYSVAIKVDDLKVSPRTYWRLGNYCQMFQGYDASCYLCNWHGTAYSDAKCNCKKEFTLEEHKINLLQVRRNFAITVGKNYFQKEVKLIKSATDEEIHKLLYSKDKYGNRQLKFFLPNWSCRAVDLEKISKHFKKWKNQLKYEICT